MCFAESTGEQTAFDARSITSFSCCANQKKVKSSVSSGHVSIACFVYHHRVVRGSWLYPKYVLTMMSSMRFDASRIPLYVCSLVNQNIWGYHLLLLGM